MLYTICVSIGDVLTLGLKYMICLNIGTEIEYMICVNIGTEIHDLC